MQFNTILSVEIETFYMEDYWIDNRVGLYKMWLGVLYHENGSYQGLIIYRKCPPQYCRTEDLAFSLDDPDVITIVLEYCVGLVVMEATC